jgi:phage regulator Rha-like protein
MDRDGFSLLAMGFTGKRALKWKLLYIEAFNRMEADLCTPAAPAPIDFTDNSQIIRLAAN